MRAGARVAGDVDEAFPAPRPKREGPAAGKGVAGHQQEGYPMETSEVLNRAADLIEERGWTAGSGWQHEAGGPLCLEGGILAAIGGSFENGDHYCCPAYKAVSAYLSDQTTPAPFVWNDRLSDHRVRDAIAAHDFSTPFDMQSVRAEADAWAKSRVIEVLRATAIIEAAKETADERVEGTA